MSANEPMRADIDRILEMWFDDSPTLAADRVVGAALAETERVRQARPVGMRVQRMWAAVTSASPVPVAAVVVALAVAIGLLVTLRQVGNPEPTPSPSASGSPLPGQLVPFRSAVDGYELLVPASWLEVPSEHPGTREWAGPDGELMISYGTSIFDGGEVTVCAPPLAGYVECSLLEHGYSIPFDPSVDGVGPISMEVWLDRCDGGCPVTTTDAALDGEVAGMDRAVISERQLTYVTTFHGRRPIVLYWNEPVEDADEARVQQMLASFRFLDPTTSPAPFLDPTELVMFGGSELGYEMLVPRFWAESASAPQPGVTTFGSGRGAATGELPALTVSIGTSDGRVVLCQPTCEAVVVTTLGEIEDVLVSVMARPDGDIPGWPRVVHGDVALGGEPGRFERADYLRRGDPEDAGLRPRFGDSSNCLGCPDMRLQLYAIHDGRPAVLAFDFWTIAFEAVGYDYFLTMVESFRFLP